MLDLRRYASLGSALRDALERWSDEICLVEADRDREPQRLTYRQFRERAFPLCRFMQERGFGDGDRAAVLMTNQSKWLISAYAILHRGGVIVPLDYKLSAVEQAQLLAHGRAKWLIVEYHLWRAIAQSGGIPGSALTHVLVTEAPANAELAGALPWEACQAKGEPGFVDRTRADAASIVYSSGTGGRPKGCVLTHDNYLEQCRSLTSLFPFRPGVRYLSILPTNHAIDFMVGFIGPFVCGATVVHLRTLRPEFIREAFSRHRITHMSLVPLVLKNLEKGLRTRFAALPAHRRALLRLLVGLNRRLTRRRPRLALSRLLLRDVHRAFGGELEALFVGGAFTEPSTLQFFYDLGIPVANGYGLTEAGTAVTLNDLNPFRSDTVGKTLPGTGVRILEPDAEGVGEIAVHGRTVMSHYLNDPELTAETIRDGWLLTGDLGRFDDSGHLQLFGRKKNMIVTEGGKNVYPEDIETAFESLPVKEFSVFAANYIWRVQLSTAEQLIIVLHPDSGGEVGEKLLEDLAARNRRLPDFKRVSGYVVWKEDFPRTASLKIKRQALAELMGRRLDRAEAVRPL
ncbi:MAG: AMP-binding protein [Acidobacteria bacterium]|nr:AMP-binding protein [Acidobacteriota bacterium]